MPVKRRPAAKRKPATKSRRTTGGLGAFQRAMKKATATVDKSIKAAEKRLKDLKKTKAAKKKAAAVKYRKASK